MEFKQIQELIRAINKSDLTEFSIKDGEFEIYLSKEPGETNVVTLPPTASLPQAMIPQSYGGGAYLPTPQAPAAAPQPASSEAPAASANKTEEKSNTVTINSPMIGTFYRSAGPDKPNFVNVGDSIKSGSVLCIVEAMKLFNEIESEIGGKIVKVLVDDASPVEYDQPLFLVEPE